jgi:tRNA-binding protein
MTNTKTISWQDFESVDIRVWTIIDVQDFPEINNPSYKVWVDFGEELWIKKTSAQITQLYTKQELIGKQILWVVNFPPKQIGKFMSEFLITWVHTENWIVLSNLERGVKNGWRLI